MPPPAKLDVTFGGMEVDKGTEVPYATAHYAATPVIKYAGANASAFYTVVMIDPDAPNATVPAYREVRHFLVGNVNGSLLSQGLSWQDSTILSDFVNPAPPEGSGYHRYVQLAFLQPGGKYINFDAVDPSIVHFNTTAFAVKYKMGVPVGCNYFKTEFSCSANLAQCGGGAAQSAPICCGGSPSYSCFEQTPYYYQCRTSCPKDQTPKWDCDKTDEVVEA